MPRLPLPSRALATCGRAARALVVLPTILSLVLSVTLPLEAASADVGSSMDSYFSSMGAAANATGPTAFQGQSAGYYTMGNLYARFPQKTDNLANIQLPSAKAGCGGIDLFAGSFSFINSAELVSLMKSIANNAVGFAFKLAIDTICPECSKVMEELNQKAQLMNQLNINSCEAAQGIVNTIAGKSDAASKNFCEMVSPLKGLFSDAAAAKEGCSSDSARGNASNAANNDPTLKDANPDVARNFTWYAMKKSPFFNDGGSFNTQLAEYVMTLVGTVIYQPAGTSGSATTYKPIGGDQSSSLVSALLDGTSTNQAKILVCDDDDACLNPVLQNLSLSQSQALRPKVRAIIESMAQAIINDTPATNAQISLLQVASLPLYKILSVQTAYGRGLSSPDVELLTEVTSIDMLYTILNEMVSAVKRSTANFVGSDDSKMTVWSDQIASAKTAIGQQQALIQGKVSAQMQIIQQTAFLESTLKSSMNPAMAASLDWSSSFHSFSR